MTFEIPLFWIFKVVIIFKAIYITTAISFELFCFVYCRILEAGRLIFVEISYDCYSIQKYPFSLANAFDAQETLFCFL